MKPKREPRLDLNPSSADRWTTCTASPHFILENWDKVPASSDTFYNQEGTTAHEVAAALLQERLPKPENCPTPIDAAMNQHGWNYAEYVTDLRQPNSQLWVESKMPLWYMPGRNAIVDAGVYNPHHSLHVIDYKYGEGVVVSPEGSLQATIYAMSIAKDLFLPKDFPVFIHIYQPRGREGSGGVWETTWGEIEHISKKIGIVATTIQDVALGNEPCFPVVFAPSEKACRWCPAKGFCTARQSSLAEGFEVLSPEIMATPKHLIPATLDIERDVVPLLKYKSDMVKFLTDVEDWAQDFMRQGGKIPGFKLVQSRGGNRVWSDQTKAAALIFADTVLKRHEVFEEKMLGPAAIEKILGKNKFSPELTNLITKAPGVPVIAPEDDKRPALNGVVDDFETITEMQGTDDNCP